MQLFSVSLSSIMLLLKKKSRCLPWLFRDGTLWEVASFELFSIFFLCFMCLNNNHLGIKVVLPPDPGFSNWRFVQSPYR